MFLFLLLFIKKKRVHEGSALVVFKMLIFSSKEGDINNISMRKDFCDACDV